MKIHLRKTRIICLIAAFFWPFSVHSVADADGIVNIIKSPDDSAVFAGEGSISHPQDFAARDTPPPIESSDSKPILAGRTKDGLKYDFYDNCVIITGCDEVITDCYIPAYINGKPVTEIGENAFAFCENLKSVTLPEGLVRIGDAAFCGCDLLKSISLPDSLLSIGDSAFSYCWSLREVKFSECLISIGAWAFHNCPLQEAALPEGLLHIGLEAFFNCSSLESLTIPKNVYLIDGNPMSFEDSSATIRVDPDNPFFRVIDGNLYNSDMTELLAVPNGGGLAELVIPNGVKRIGNYACFVCFFDRVVIPNGVTEIGAHAFACAPIHEVVLPEGLNTIEESAFDNCMLLESVTIPKSVQKIENEAFMLTRVKDVFYSGTKAQWDKISFGENIGIENAIIHFGNK